MNSDNTDTVKAPQSPSRNRLDEKHRPKNRTFRSVFENTGTGTVLIEADMTISMANSGFENITGLPRESIENRMRLTDFIHPEDRNRIEQYHIGRREGRVVPGDYQCRLNSRSSGLRHMAVKAEIIDGTGRSVLSFMDITELVRSKEALERNEQRLTNLMNRLPGMAYRWEGEMPYLLTFVSKGCLRLTGYNASQLTGSDPAYTSLIHPEDREWVAKAVRRALYDRQPFELTYRIRTAAEKETWVWDRGAGIFSREGETVAVEGFIADFSQYKEMEHKFLLREEQLINENERLRSSVSGICGLCDLVGKSEPMQRVYKLIRQASATDNGVVLYGESGTGKELAARCIHRLSHRRNGSFVVVNCGAVPDTIFESEFFGHRKRGVQRGGQGHGRLSGRGRRRNTVSGRSRRNQPIRPGKTASGHRQRRFYTGRRTPGKNPGFADYRRHQQGSEKAWSKKEPCGRTSFSGSMYSLSACHR